MRAKPSPHGEGVRRASLWPIMQGERLGGNRVDAATQSPLGICQASDGSRRSSPPTDRNNPACGIAPLEGLPPRLREAPLTAA